MHGQRNVKICTMQYKNLHLQFCILQYKLLCLYVYYDFKIPIPVSRFEFSYPKFPHIPPFIPLFFNFTYFPHFFLRSTVLNFNPFFLNFLSYIPVCSFSHSFHLVSLSLSHPSLKSQLPNFPSAYSSGTRTDLSVLWPGYWPDDRCPLVWFPVREKNISHLQFVQTDCGAHPAAYSMGNGDSWPGGRAAAAWSWPLSHLVPRLRISGGIPPFPVCLHGVQRHVKFLNTRFNSSYVSFSLSSVYFCLSVTTRTTQLFTPSTTDDVLLKDPTRHSCDIIPTTTA